VQIVKRATLIAVLALATIGLTGILATNGYAHPGYGTPCVASGCHDAGDPRLEPAPTPAGLIPTTTVDATCAVTVSNAVSSYRGDAVLHLSATDNVGGWGVGYLYYSLDGAPVRLIRVPVDWTNSMGSMSCEASIPVSAPASGHVAHTISFWSQDNFGNVETPTVQAFTVNARTKMSMPISVNHSSVKRNHSVVISGTVAKAGIKVVLYVRRPGSSSYTPLKTLTASSAKKWSYTYKLTRRGPYYFKARFAGDGEWLASSSASRKVSVR
jgi:hypothetical protein